MTRSIERVFVPPGSEDFRKYLIPDTKPPLNTDALFLDLLIGEDRKDLKAVTDGDWSLVVYYKDKEAYLASFREEERSGDTGLQLIQLQGVNSRTGYRVVSGMDVLAFISAQIDKFSSHPENPYSYLCMPPMALIQGMIDASERAILRYELASRMLGLRSSQDRNLLVRKLK